MSSQNKWMEKHYLTAILLAAVLLRVLAALFLGNQVVVLPGTHDQISYDALAQSLLAGEGYRFSENWYPFTPADTPTAHWSFLYPLFLAGVYSLFGYNPLLARLFQGILGGVLTSLLIYGIGRRVGDRNAALVGAGLAAVYGYFIYYHVALMTETFFMIAMLGSLHFGLLLKERPRLRYWIFLGLTMGVGVLLRQTMLMLVPLILLWLWWELRRRMRLWHLLVPLGIIALMIFPWTLRNLQVYDEFLLLNSNAGYALYASNHPRLGTSWRNDDIVVPIPEEMAGLNEAEMDRAMTQKAVGFVLDEPGRYLLLSMSKTLQYFKFWPTSDSGLLSNISRTFSFGLYLPFMVWGLLLSRAHWRRYLPIYLLSGFHTAVYLLSWPAPRYRLPVDAMLMPLVGLAVLELARQIVLWRRATTGSLPEKPVPNKE